MAQQVTQLYYKKKFIRKSLEPFLVGIEPITSKFVRNRLIVLYAHLYPEGDVPLDREDIKRNLKYLSDECQVLPLPEALDILSNDWDLPHRAVAIIVDDATQAFFQVGRKLLSDAGLPYTLAVIPGLIRSKGKEHLLARLMRIAGHSYWLSNQEMLERVLEWFGDTEHQETVSFDTVFSKASKLSELDLTRLLDHVRALDHDFMTWEELKELKSQDEVHFASHTMSHPQLRHASGAWLDWELSRSKAMLEKNLGVTVNTLVFPYGNPKNLTLEVHQALDRHGYKNSFFTEKGAVGPDTMRYSMPRLPLEDEFWRLRIHSCPAICSILYPGPKQGRVRSLGHQKYLSI